MGATPARPKTAERRKIPRQQPTEQDPGARARNFLEVCLGLSEEQARTEAARCIECKKPSCIEGCPVGVDVKGFIRRIAARDYLGALDTIRKANVLPGICGRVCPQETQCEAVCGLGKKLTPVAIGKLERFVADWEAAQAVRRPRPPSHSRDEAVAVVGSGPAGLTCAADLATLGYRVTVFEALHAVGGVLRYGIPGFRLPREVLDRELDTLRELGVEIRTNFLVGRSATVDELFYEWGFAAIFLATGAGTPTFLGIPGESLTGVYSANEFLTRVNLMHADRFPSSDTPLRLGRAVAVIGGGNTAMDAARTARRLGAERASLVYRRSRQEMPARAEEVRHAEEEGIELRVLTHPLRVLADERNWVRGLECQRLELGEPDESGRRKPVPIAGTEFVLEVETVIEAIGQKPNPIVQATTPGLAVGHRGTVTVDEVQQTNLPGVFAGGDLSRGGATVILAMRDGRRAAAAIHAYLRELKPEEDGPPLLLQAPAREA